MADLTICVPISKAHEQIADRARRSVKAQTIPVDGIQVIDTDGKGAGWTRNQLLAQVDTPYVAFLDADDWIEPTFAADMLCAANDSQYVYSAWFEAEPGGVEVLKVPSAQCYCFAQDNWWNVHLITCLIPTEWARAIGGFDETLIGMEDTDFFHRLHEVGHCGKLVNKPLIHYTMDGERSRSFQQSPDYLLIKSEIGKRYNKGAAMACCDGQGITNEGPFGDPQAGDVLARALGPTFQVYVGRQSGRLYRNVGYGQLVWADPADVQTDPVRFALAETNAADVAAFMASNANGVRKLATDPTRAPVTDRKSGTDLAKMAGFFGE